MTESQQVKRDSERGAIVIHVAIALIALMCFAAIVVDQGVMLVARRQAQNAADAGALAGALSLRDDFSKTAEATAAANLFAGQMPVWGQSTAPANLLVSPLPFNCPDGQPACIRVDVYRGIVGRDGVGHTNTLPTYMMGLIGIKSDGVRATATAQVAAGNSITCIKPWIVADRWVDNSGTGLNPGGWDQMDTFNPGVDSYTPHGFSAETDTGYELMLKGDGHDWSAGWSLEIDLNGGNGGNVYRDEIAGCPSWVPAIGLWAGQQCSDNPGDINYEKGCLNVKTGVKQGPTTQGVSDLIALDPSATWNTSTNSVSGGCMATNTCSNPTGANVSPRVVPIALFDPAAYSAGGFNGNGGMARVINLLGFFIEGMCSDVYPSAATRPAWCGTPAEASKMVTGRLMKYPGQGSGASGSAGPWTFLKIVRLIR